jgi:hypothetical protein
VLNRILTSRPGRRLLMVVFRGFDLLAGHWGNGLVLVAWKKP